MNNHRHKSKLVYLPRCEDPGDELHVSDDGAPYEKGAMFSFGAEKSWSVVRKGFGLTDLGTFIRYLHLAIFEIIFHILWLP